MGGRRLLGDVQSPNLTSRRDDLAVSVGVKIDGAVHEDEILKRGLLLALIIASGKYRAYFEAATTGIEFSNASPNFAVDPADSGAKHLRVGDVVEGVDDTALGEVLTYVPATGLGTLTGNSANNFSGQVRVDDADLELANKSGRILKNEMVVDGTEDKAEAAYSEGFFTEARIPNMTAAAKTSLGTSAPSSGELRLL